MGKVKQLKGRKGSLSWIQQVVNDCPDVLNKPINGFIGSSKKQTYRVAIPIKAAYSLCGIRIDRFYFRPSKLRLLRPCLL